MSTEQCARLRAAYLPARSRRKTKVIVLMGGRDFFSNGIHLNVIEAADDPAGESWRNLVAIDDLVREIVETESHLVVSALTGDAAAGGVPFALAADQVYAREDMVLNPYYGHMGGLYGSEYWTYLLPRRVGAHMTARLTGPPFTPLGTAQAVGSGCWTRRSAQPRPSFQDQIRSLARGLASDPHLSDQLDTKRRRRARDERVKPLRAYRAEEMVRRTSASSGPTTAITRQGGGSPASSGRLRQPRRTRARGSPRDAGQPGPGGRRAVAPEAPQLARAGFRPESAKSALPSMRLPMASAELSRRIPLRKRDTAPTHGRAPVSNPSGGTPG